MSRFAHLPLDHTTAYNGGYHSHGLAARLAGAGLPLTAADMHEVLAAVLDCPAELAEYAADWARGWADAETHYRHVPAARAVGEILAGDARTQRAFRDAGIPGF